VTQDNFAIRAFKLDDLTAVRRDPSLIHCPHLLEGLLERVSPIDYATRMLVACLYRLNLLIEQAVNDSEAFPQF
jgi:hypothetical protein